MTIIIFFIILAVLILVHELGHFLAAKWAGIRVDEFGLGFPPRVAGVRRGETLYSLNWIPFGGFVKIFGETPDAESLAGPDAPRSMVHKPKYKQAVVLVAGVTFNVILAWFLLSIGLMIGLPASLGAIPEAYRPERGQLLVLEVAAGSPAAEAGLVAGSELVSLRAVRGIVPSKPVTELSPEVVQNFVASHPAEPIMVEYRRPGVGPTGAVQSVTLTPRVLGESAGGKPAIGVGLDEVATWRQPWWRAIGSGLVLTARLTWVTIASLAHLVTQAFQGQADLKQVTGPVGLVGIVGQAASLGFVYLLNFTALISINLAVINLVPFPALDGGRLLFLLIEKIKGSAIKPAVANTLNMIGFALLLIFMGLVTYGDVLKLMR